VAGHGELLKEGGEPDGPGSAGGLDRGDVETQTASVARTGEETGKEACRAELQSQQRPRHIPDRHRTHLQRDLARLAVFADLGLVLQAQVQGRQSGRV